MPQNIHAIMRAVEIFHKSFSAGGINKGLRDMEQCDIT